MKIAPPATRPFSVSGLRIAVGSLMHSRLDRLQLAVHVDVRVGDGQVIGRRQALLLGAVLRIGLHVLAEDVAGDGGDDLVGRDRAEPADRVAAHREAALGPQVGVVGSRCSASGWSMPTQKKSWPSIIMLWNAAMMSPGRTSRLPSPRGAVIDPRHAVDLFLAVLARHGVAERGLDLARQMVARRRERIVHALEHREGHGSP